MFRKEKLLPLLALAMLALFLIFRPEPVGDSTDTTAIVRPTAPSNKPQLRRVEVGKKNGESVYYDFHVKHIIYQASCGNCRTIRVRGSVEVFEESMRAGLVLDAIRRKDLGRLESLTGINFRCNSFEEIPKKALQQIATNSHSMFVNFAFKSQNIADLGIGATLLHPCSQCKATNVVLGYQGEGFKIDNEMLPEEKAILPDSSEALLCDLSKGEVGVITECDACNTFMGYSSSKHVEVLAIELSQIARRKLLEHDCHSSLEGRSLKLKFAYRPSKDQHPEAEMRSAEVECQNENCKEHSSSYFILWPSDMYEPSARGGPLCRECKEDSLQMTLEAR